MTTTNPWHERVREVLAEIIAAAERAEIADDKRRQQGQRPDFAALKRTMSTIQTNIYSLATAVAQGADVEARANKKP